MAQDKPGQHRLESNNPDRVDSQRGSRISFKANRRRKKKRKRT